MLMVVVLDGMGWDGSLKRMGLVVKEEGKVMPESAALDDAAVPFWPETACGCTTHTPIQQQKQQ